MKLTEHKIPVVEMTLEEYRCLTYSPIQESINNKKITTKIQPNFIESMIAAIKVKHPIIIKFKQKGRSRWITGGDFSRNYLFEL